MEPLILVEWIEGADRSLPLPRYATPGAAGADLCANLPEGMREAGLTLQPGARALVPTGLRMQIPQGYEVQVRPRSGLALAHGLTLPNSPGTIDCDYRGPVGVILMNAGEAAYTVSHGDRIAQAVVAPVLRADFAFGALDRTARGVGGFGSTGVGPAQGKAAGESGAGPAVADVPPRPGAGEGGTGNYRGTGDGLGEGVAGTPGAAARTGPGRAST